MRRIAFYGGSFNPAHIGHQSGILHTLALADVEEMFIAPVYKHYDGKQLVDWNHRLVMCQKMIAPFYGAWVPVHVSEVEKLCYDKCNGVTSDVVRSFRKMYGLEKDHIVLVLGSDIQPIIHKWEGYDELKEMEFDGRLSFFFVERYPRVSSTEIRQQLKEGHPELAERWVPKSIILYIKQNDLYPAE